MTDKKQEKQTPSRISVKIDDVPEKWVLQKFEKKKDNIFILTLDSGERWEFDPDHPDKQTAFVLSEKGRYEKKPMPPFEYQTSLIPPSCLQQLQIWTKDEPTLRARIHIKTKRALKVLIGDIRPLPAPVSVEEGIDVLMNAGDGSEEETRSAKNKKEYEEKARQEIKQAETTEEAVAIIAKKFGHLDGQVRDAGCLHLFRGKEMSQEEIRDQCRKDWGWPSLGKTTVWRKIDKFYSETGISRPNYQGKNIASGKQSLGGRAYSYNDKMDPQGVKEFEQQRAKERKPGQAID